MSGYSPCFSTTSHHPSNILQWCMLCTSIISTHVLAISSKTVLSQDDVMILDIDENPKVTIGDQEVRQYLLDHFQISKPSNVQAIDKEQRNQILLSLLDFGAGFRQLSRLTGVPYGVIHRLSSKR